MMSPPMLLFYKNVTDKSILFMKNDIFIDLSLNNKGMNCSLRDMGNRDVGNGLTTILLWEYNMLCRLEMMLLCLRNYIMAQ